MKITERGWPGHFIMSHRCVYHRNTLIEHGNIAIVVSTVGRCLDDTGETIKIGYKRYYETMAFFAQAEDQYWEADVGKEIRFESDWQINKLYPGVDNDADKMHEAVVREMVIKIRKEAL